MASSLSTRPSTPSSCWRLALAARVKKAPSPFWRTSRSFLMYSASMPLRSSCWRLSCCSCWFMRRTTRVESSSSRVSTAKPTRPALPTCHTSRAMVPASCSAIVSGMAGSARIQVMSHTSRLMRFCTRPPALSSKLLPPSFITLASRDSASRRRMGTCILSASCRECSASMPAASTEANRAKASNSLWPVLAPVPSWVMLWLSSQGLARVASMPISCNRVSRPMRRR
ncbi:hypothetical protein D3C87_879330 [compost metagenome]